MDEKTIAAKVAKGKERQPRLVQARGAEQTVSDEDDADLVLPAKAKRRRPDPRIAQTRALVLAATRELVSEVGFEGATIERIAERGGVARSTIYRHWPDPTRLYLQAFEPEGDAVLPPRTGRLRDDLLGYAQHVADYLNDPVFFAALVARLDKACRDPEYRELHLEFSRERDARGLAIFADGIEAGTVRADIDPDHELTTILSGMTFRRLIRFEEITRDVTERLVDDVCTRIKVPPRR